MTAITSPSSLDWSQLPLTDLLDAILREHHAQLRRALQSLNHRLGRIAAVHGLEYFRLQEIALVYLELQSSLEHYMSGESATLFPCLLNAEGDVGGKSDRNSRLALEAVQDARRKQQEVAHLMAQLRRLTDGYQAPDQACADYREALHDLAELDQALSEHYGNESRVLFARFQGPSDGEAVS
jgi:regulator of cell morphogenesis and NO signaling